MSEASTSRPSDHVVEDRAIRRSSWLLSGSFLILGLVTVIRLFAGTPRPVDWFVGLLVLVAGFAVAMHRSAVGSLEAERRSEAESFARVFRGLSRSISPDAIVDAIVEELGVGTNADHTVVVRLRPESDALEATLVSRRPGVPSSTTILPRSDLEDPGANPIRLERLPVAIPVGTLQPVGVGRPAAPPGIVGVLGAVAAIRAFGATTVPPSASGAWDGPEARIAARIARRVRDVYGLRHTIEAPLVTSSGTVGAIVLSRRSEDPWTGSAGRILAGAAVEASAALERAYSHRAAEARASTDALTGLPNRRYFDEFCGLLARRRRADDVLGVLMIDIDHFKRLNDTYGHATGDEVLRSVAGAIAAAVRTDDVPARFGGEEFAILLRDPSPSIAAEVGERVRTAVAELDLDLLHGSRVTVSVGVAVSVAPAEPIDEVIAAADRALYAAKRAGRNRVVVGPL
ncbi:MAG: GGDEF domain-containing protein [Chloroflexi bacterium]|nr:GGDEF domain-containing protein [Chloroflexota bacterium]